VVSKKEAMNRLNDINGLETSSKSSLLLSYKKQGFNDYNQSDDS